MPCSALLSWETEHGMISASQHTLLGDPIKTHDHPWCSINYRTPHHRQSKSVRPGKPSWACGGEHPARKQQSNGRENRPGHSSGNAQVGFLGSSWRRDSDGPSALPFSPTAEPAFLRSSSRRAEEVGRLVQEHRGSLRRTPPQRPPP